MFHLPNRRTSVTGLLRAGVIAVALSLLAPTAASACEVPMRTDGRNATWCFTSSMDGRLRLQDAARWAISNLATSTVMTTTAVASCDPAVNPGVDYRLIDEELGDGFYGRTVCRSWTATAGVCDRFDVSANRRGIDSALTVTYYDQYTDGVDEPGELEINFKKTWCHELGHTVSLDHHPTNYANRFTYYTGVGDKARDCMVRGHIEVASEWLRYNAHHVGEVAGRI